MNGHHDVQAFRVSTRELEDGWSAPDGWKPFGVGNVGAGWTTVVCRNWRREEKT